MFYNQGLPILVDFRGCGTFLLPFHPQTLASPAPSPSTRVLDLDIPFDLDLVIPFNLVLVIPFNLDLVIPFNLYL